MRLSIVASSVLVVFLLCAAAHGATSRYRYEAAYASVNGGDGYKTYDNTNATLAWGESYIMMSIMVMYHATGERLYLDRLADHADHVLATRDDLAGVTEYGGLSSPCWRNTKYQPDNEAYCYVVHSGMLTFPMADFVHAVYQRPELWDLPTWDGETYKETADLFLQRVEETVAFHDFQWQDGPGPGEGHYVFDPGASFLDYAGQEMPLNQENAMGRTLVMLYLVTGEPEYLSRASALANRFQGQLTVQDDCYLWNYWGGTYSAPGEDISHAAINADFARLCAAHGILFNETDLGRFANTVFSRVYKDSDTLYDRIGGSGSTNGSGYKPQIARWLHLTPAHPSLYTIVRNIYDGYETSTGSGSLVFGFAMLAAYEPVVRPHYFYSVDWAAADGVHQATAQNANILTVPPDPAARTMVPITYRSIVPVSVQQWDDEQYHEVARWTPTAGTWRTLWLPYHPEHWHPYWQGGALFQFTESPFAGIEVEDPDELSGPTLETTELPEALIGEAYAASLSATGPEPRVWHLVEAPLGLELSWDGGLLSWDEVPGPQDDVEVTVRVGNDYGVDEATFVLQRQYADGEPCDDEDPCTVADAWQQGECAGTDMDCGQDGWCVAGECVYPVEPEADVWSAEDVVDVADLDVPATELPMPDAPDLAKMDLAGAEELPMELPWGGLEGRPGEAMGPPAPGPVDTAPAGGSPRSGGCRAGSSGGGSGVLLLLLALFVTGILGPRRGLFPGPQAR